MNWGGGLAARSSWVGGSDWDQASVALGAVHTYAARTPSSRTGSLASRHRSPRCKTNPSPLVISTEDGNESRGILPPRRL